MGADAISPRRNRRMMQEIRLAEADDGRGRRPWRIEACIHDGRACRVGNIVAALRSIGAMAAIIGSSAVNDAFDDEGFSSCRRRWRACRADFPERDAVSTEIIGRSTILSADVRVTLTDIADTSDPCRVTPVDKESSASEHFGLPIQSAGIWLRRSADSLASTATHAAW